MSEFNNWFGRQEKFQVAVYILVVGFVVWRQLPIFLHNSGKEGTRLETKTYQVLGGKSAPETLKFPGSGKKILIFWATWCGPCKLEMKRLKSSVEEGKIGDGAIVAVNSHESPSAIKKFLTEAPYPFTFIDAPELSSVLGARATPTTVFLEDGQVTSMSSGMSLIGIWRAEDFL